MKKLLIACGVVLGGLAIVIGALWYWMGQPMYRPGMLRQGPGISRPLQSHDENYWEMGDGIRLYHFAEGSGPNVLVVHGGPGQPFHLAPPGLVALASRYRVHYYDQRGCGRSTRPFDRFASSNYYQNMKDLDRRLGLAAQIADIERIRKILGEERLILIGHSFGAFLASLYAAEFPEHIKGMLLVAPADLLKMPPADGGLYEQVRARLPQTMKAEYAAYLKRYLDFSGIFKRSEAGLQEVNTEFAKYYSAAGGKLPPGETARENGGWMVYAMYFSMGRWHDYRPALRQVTAPVLVVHGAADLQPEKASRAFAAAFPNARVAVIPNAGHFCFYDQPAEFARVAGEFMSQL